jgi:hypothetical protein
MAEHREQIYTRITNDTSIMSSSDAHVHARIARDRGSSAHTLLNHTSKQTTKVRYGERVDELQLMIVLTNFANALSCIGEQVRRKLILQQCLSLNEKNDGVDSIRTATSLHNLGLTTAGVQEWPEYRGTTSAHTSYT